MIEVISHASSPEHGRKSHIRWHMLLRYHLVSAFWLTNDELTDLQRVSLVLFGLKLGTIAHLQLSIRDTSPADSRIPGPFQTFV